MIATVFAQAAPPSSQPAASAPPSAPDLLPATPPEPALQKIEKWIEGFFFLLPNIAVAIAVLVLIYLLGVAARWGVVTWGRHRGRTNLGEVLGGFVKWAVVGLGLLIAMTIVFPSVRPVDLLAGLGVGSVAIGFAFKDILQNWLAGLLLLIRQPFQVGDQVVIMGFEGTVERIERRSTDLMTYDGRRVLIPNSEVYSSAVVINTAFAKRRSEYDLGIGYGDDIRHACAVVLDAITGIDGIARDPAPAVLPWSIDPSQVTLKVWWWTGSAQIEVLETRARVIAAIKNALDAAGIDMPFETVVQLWHDQTEETDGVRGRQREGWPRRPDAPPPRPARLINGPDQSKEKQRSAY
ncbi:MAG: mechanosensitive ion channel family protein [Xanthobacteraceae bacterium]